MPFVKENRFSFWAANRAIRSYKKTCIALFRQAVRGLSRVLGIASVNLLHRLSKPFYTTAITAALSPVC